VQGQEWPITLTPLRPPSQVITPFDYCNSSCYAVFTTLLDSTSIRRCSTPIRLLFDFERQSNLSQIVVVSTALCDLIRIMPVCASYRLASRFELFQENYISAAWCECRIWWFLDDRAPSWLIACVPAKTKAYTFSCNFSVFGNFLRRVHVFFVTSTVAIHLFHKSFPPQSASTHLDCLLGLYWTRLTLLNGFSFLVIFLLFYFGSCGRLSWLDCQLSSAR